MEVWIFAAAAAAGIFAKYVRNYPRDRKMPVLEVSSGASDGKELNSPMPVYKLESKDVPFQTKRGNPGGSEFIEGGDCVSDVNREVVTSYYVLPMGVSCNCGNLDEKFQNSGSQVDQDSKAVSNLSPRLCNGNLEEKVNKAKDTNGIVHCPGYHVSMNTRGEIGKSSSNKTTLRYKQPRLPLTKLVDCLESCLVAQLYEEHTKVNSLVSSISAASVATLRPLLIANEHQMISLLNEEVMQLGGGEEDFLPCWKDKIVVGIPPLPRANPSDISKKVKHKLGKRQLGSLKTFRPENCQSQTHQKARLFGLGICAGTISSAMAHKKEVDKVKELLKQTQNLVEDLQEELEMKEMLTVKELADENCELYCNHDGCFYERTLGVLTPKLNDYEGPIEHAMEKSSQTRSNIEEELEAELERLELRMNSSSLETRVSNLAEVDPEFVADFVSGMLKAGANSTTAYIPPDSNRSTPETHTENYMVSPQELSLRLHQVIQSRLEQRVKELEAAVQNSHKKVDLAHSECLKETNGMALAKTYLREQPVVVNLSEDPFDAYSETYEELTNIEGLEDECSAFSFCQKDAQDCLLAYPKSESGESSTTCKLKEPAHQVSSFHRLGSEEINDNTDDVSDAEMERVLIQQIVEKTRNRSPIVWNAQKLLYSVCEPSMT